MAVSRLLHLDFKTVADFYNYPWQYIRYEQTLLVDILSSCVVLCPFLTQGHLFSL